MGLQARSSRRLLGDDRVGRDVGVMPLSLDAQREAAPGGQRPGLGNPAGDEGWDLNVLGRKHDPHGDERARAQGGDEAEGEEAVSEEKDGESLEAQEPMARVP